MSFLCNICGYLCDSAQQLAVHENNGHSSRAALCEICGKIIAGKHRVASHRVSHETAEWSLRTCNTISDNQSEWEIETNSNRSLLKNYKSCEFKPLEFKMCQYETAVLFLLPPDPLHVNYLGPVNDVFDLLEENFPNELKTFYEKYHLKKVARVQEVNFMVPP